MIISEVQHIIDALDKTLPDGFIFVLDTTDRSFIYKSKSDHSCMDRVLKLDKDLGIDKLMKELNFYDCEENGIMLMLKALGESSFLGFCIDLDQYDAEQLQLAKDIVHK